MSGRVWTCQRVSAGVACKHRNPSIKRNCQLCGKPRPKRARPAHLRALENDYDAFIALNGGEHCAICLRPPSGTRRLDRDHCHTTGRARGLLCPRCNRALPNWITGEWLRAAADYVERAEKAA
jgi:hypothetical protein